MRFLWLLFFLPTMAIGQTEFSGVETYRFRNGVYPDASYNGMVLQQINMAAKTTTYTNWTFASMGDTVSSSPYQTKMRALWKCDISALPDSAVIVSATLRLLVRRTAVSSTCRIQGFRVMFPWTSTATWNTRGTSPDSTWTINAAAASQANGGLSDSSGTMVVRGSNIALTESNLGKWPLSSGTAAYTQREGSGTGTGATNYWTCSGADTVQSSYEAASGLGMARTAMPDFDVQIRTAATIANDTAWVNINITDIVRKWHSHQWSNYGLLLTASGTNGATLGNNWDQFANSALTERIRIVTPSYSYHNLYSRRPMLIVRTLTATTSGNGVGAAYLGRRWPLED